MPTYIELSEYAALVLIIYLIFIALRRIRQWQIDKLEYKREFSDTGVFEGQTITLTETIYNKTFLPMLFVDVEAFIHCKLRIDSISAGAPDDEMQYLVSRFQLMPYMKIKRTHTVNCIARGYYLLSNVCIFNLNRENPREAPAELFVYPMLNDFSAVPRPQNNLQGDCISLRRLLTDPFSITGIRDYQSGDPFNLINFKASARTGFGKLKVNQRDFSSSRIFKLYINFQTDINSNIQTVKYESLMEKALSDSATIIQSALESGHHVGFSANCYMINGDMYLKHNITAGAYYFEEMLKEMSMIRPRAGISFLSLVEFDLADGLKDSEVMIFTSYIDEVIDDEILKLEHNGNSVNIFLLRTDDDEALEGAQSPI
ncbi:MAG: DUF58 domain-containing protein [Oscillospiraceae bacterium]|nr:DUF58 domain-containing protein [Oscillospiraceae bacterium]